MYSTVKRARDIKKALREKMPASREALEMLDIFRDDDFIPLEQEELKLVLRCGIQSWDIYSKKWENPEESFELILNTLKKLKDCDVTSLDDAS